MNASLTERGFEYGFYQAVRLLAGSEPQFRRELEVLDRSIEFRTETGSQFPSSEISEITEDGARHRVVVNCFGISGPLGPLPDSHNNWINFEDGNGRHQLKQFLELFNHRLIGLLYLIKKRCALGLHSGAPEDTELYRYLSHVGNLAATPGRPVVAPDQMPLQGFAGLLAGDRVSVPRIDGVVSAYLDVPVSVRSFVGAFVPIDFDQQTVLSHRPSPQSTLGSGRAIGTRVWRQDYGIGLEVGPVNYETAVNLQPGSDDFDRLRDLLVYVTDGRWAICLDLLVHASGIPKSALGNGEPGTGLNLGYSGWVKTEDSDDDDAAVFRTRRFIKPFSVH